MSRNILLFLCLFSISGLIWSAHGDEETDTTGVEATNDSNAPSESQSGTVIGDMITNSIWTLMQMTLSLFQPLLDSFKTLFGDVLEYLASSNVTSLAFNEGINMVDYLENNSQNGESLAAMLSSIFMMPFKTVFGAVRSLPVDPMYQESLKMFGPIRILLQNPAVQVALNSSKVVVDAATASAWNFTKISVLPRMDQLITNVKESNSLPENVVSYLTELQTFYHICKTLQLM